MPSIPREIRGDALPDGIRFLSEACGPPPACADHGTSPVFLMSAGWRSGSTLVQRLICSNRSALIWGEPFEDHIPICRMAASVQHFGEDDSHQRHSFRQDQGDLPKDWIANLNPGFDALRNAHLAFFETLFAEPATAGGYSRWGVKSVRLSGFHATYLRWLYPQARFVFLVRHPLSAYRSYRGKRWYLVRPTHRVVGIRSFLHHWRYLASSFLSQREAVGAFFLRYEDLVDSPDLVQKLGEYLGLRLDPSILELQIGARSARQRRVTIRERWMCRRIAGDVCRQLEYESLPAEPSRPSSSTAQAAATI